jgi:hypothetical protein
MRTLLLVTLAVVLGVALGAGTAMLRIGRARPDPKPGEIVEKKTAAALPAKGPRPKVVVDAAEYDFGTRDIEVSNGSHDFVLTNAGDGPLELRQGGTSCRCAMSKLGKEQIPPGGTAKITITWKHIDKLGPSRQTVTILTNDPAQALVTLAISGQVTAAMRFSPAELVFSRLSVGESATGQSRLFCYREKPLKIVGQKWSDAATAPYFDVRQQPLSADELKQEPSARHGLLVTVTIKPGLLPGPMHQRLTIETDTAAATLSIEGHLGSEIAVVGRGWDPDTGVLTLGEVPRHAGLQRRLMLAVRGPLRKQVTVKPQNATPDVLKVSLGQPSEINNGAVVGIPLIIDIPPDSPPVNRLGTEQGQLGEIILETSHPRVPKLRISVRFAIAG